MSPNFAYLAALPEYALFAPAAVEAERVLAASPAMCAVGCRKVLELAVKWVYAADNTIKLPYRDNLMALIHEESFRFALDKRTWGKLPFIVKLGNLAVHTEKSVSRSDAVLALSGLFEFIQWVDYCYGAHYEPRTFCEAAIPAEGADEAAAAKAEMETLLAQKDAELEALRAAVAAQSAPLTAAKAGRIETRRFAPGEVSEYETRKKYIDVDLKLEGWVFDGPGQNVLAEFEVDDMQPGQKGYVDYVLVGADGRPLALVEAKRTAYDPHKGRQQAKLYADALERRFGRRPVMFYTNGFETWFWDDTAAPPREVSGVFSRADLERLVQRRGSQKPLASIDISDAISDRYYQKQAIRTVCEEMEKGLRKHLLVMATGTGKTRTAGGLVDVLSRGGHVTNVLFLADRRELVRQAKDGFKNYLPDMSLCNLLSSKDDKNARVVFSTYPTILNAIDTAKNDDGVPLFTPAHFDLVVIDEAHRSIFKKYRAIFAYFDAHLVGLTATPVSEVDRNTYDFFEKEPGVPSFAYDYDTAVEKDRVLVPYNCIEVSTKFLQEGIHYDELSEEDKARYEEDFAEDDEMPEAILPGEINEYCFNQGTVDMVLDTLMTRGIKTAGGDRIGKTIIFAQNKRHAQFIVERFDALYPQHKGEWARRITHGDDYAETLITDFKQPEKPPYIAVSVDMLDTGIDVREIVNLVFFKRVRSKTKFWQMIGRGTRICPELECVDGIDGTYIGKRRFYIFDFLGNFEFFRERQNGIEGRETQTLTEAIFTKRVRIAAALQEAPYAEADYQAYRGETVAELAQQVAALNPEQVSVRLQLQHVEKFKEETAFGNLSSQDRHDLNRHIAPLVYLDDEDEYAKRFDNLMYGLMLASLENLPGIRRGKRDVQSICRSLLEKGGIAQVKAQLPLIQRVTEEAFWKDAGLFAFEEVRVNLRALIKLLVETTGKSPVYTALTDEFTELHEGETAGAGYDFADYRLKVEHYLAAHADELAIHKLRNNVPLTELDYKQLEHIFTGKLGTREDYERAFGDTPFGLLVRRIAKMDRVAAMGAFSAFIGAEGLSAAQIAFVDKVVDYIAANGYMENVAELMHPPFDKPQSFVRLFSAEEQRELIDTVNGVKHNAVHVVG